MDVVSSFPKKKGATARLLYRVSEYAVWSSSQDYPTVGCLPNHGEVREVQAEGKRSVTSNQAQSGEAEIWMHYSGGVCETFITSCTVQLENLHCGQLTRLSSPTLWTEDGATGRMKRNADLTGWAYHSAWRASDADAHAQILGENLVYQVKVRVPLCVFQGDLVSPV